MSTRERWLSAALVVLALSLAASLTVLARARHAATQTPAAVRMDAAKVTEYLKLAKDGWQDFHELARQGNVLFVEGHCIPDHATLFNGFPASTQEDGVVYTLWSVVGEEESASISIALEPKTGRVLAFTTLKFGVERNLAPPKGLQLPTSAEWPAAAGKLEALVTADQAQCAPGAIFGVKLFLRAVDKAPKLLQGRFVFTFVPIDRMEDVEALAAVRHFSGAGGIDYSGKQGVPYQIVAPKETGRYYLFANVVSTKDDIFRHLVVAKVAGGPEQWWAGSIASPPVVVEVVRR